MLELDIEFIRLFQPLYRLRYIHLNNMEFLFWRNAEFYIISSNICKCLTSFSSINIFSFHLYFILRHLDLLSVVFWIFDYQKNAGDFWDLRKRFYQFIFLVKNFFNCIELFDQRNRVFQPGVGSNGCFIESYILSDKFTCEKKLYQLNFVYWKFENSDALLFIYRSGVFRVLFYPWVYFRELIP